MKKIFLTLLVATMALASCTNSEKSRVEGRIGNFAGEGMIYITNKWGDKAVIDSTTIVKGVFCFENVPSEPTLAQLEGEDGSYITMFFIEPGKINVVGDAAEYNVKAVGSPANDAFNAFMEKRNQIEDAVGKARQENDSEAYEKAIEEYDDLVENALKENYNNIFGIFLLQQVSYSESAHYVLTELEKFPEAIRQTSTAQKIKERAEQRRKTEPQVEGSDIVPYYIDIVQPTPAGENVSLKSVVENKANRYVLLDFWASWCGPCMREMPYLLEAYKKYHNKGFEIYGVSLDRTAEAWKAAIKDKKLRWVNVSTIESFNNPAADDYAVNSIPTNFLIDCSTGVIIEKNLRGEEVIEKLEELLK